MKATLLMESLKEKLNYSRLTTIRLLTIQAGCGKIIFYFGLTNLVLKTIILQYFLILKPYEIHVYTHSTCFLHSSQVITNACIWNCLIDKELTVTA